MILFQSASLIILHYLVLMQSICVYGSISPNLKAVVYMGGIKYGGDAEWQFIWNQFERTQTPSEKSKLLAALSASTDILVLNRYFSAAPFTRLFRISCLCIGESTDEVVIKICLLKWKLV